MFKIRPFTLNMQDDSSDTTFFVDKKSLKLTFSLFCWIYPDSLSNLNHLSILHFIITDEDVCTENFIHNLASYEKSNVFNRLIPNKHHPINTLDKYRLILVGYF